MTKITLLQVHLLENITTKAFQSCIYPRRQTEERIQGGGWETKIFYLNRKYP